MDKMGNQNKRVGAVLRISLAMVLILALGVPPVPAVASRGPTATINVTTPLDEYDETGEGE